jgi:hypothetical protein
MSAFLTGRVTYELMATLAELISKRSCVSRACVDRFGSFFRPRVFRPESS